MGAMFLCSTEFVQKELTWGEMLRFFKVDDDALENALEHGTSIKVGCRYWYIDEAL